MIYSEKSKKIEKQIWKNKNKSLIIKELQYNKAVIQSPFCNFK